MGSDFSQAHHLPKVRDAAGGQPVAPPHQRRGTTPQMVGRYPDYDCLTEAGHWDELTRALVLARVEQVPEPRFFDPAEQATLSAFCDRALAQDGEPRIPVLAFVDRKLERAELDGFRYADMPDDRETWRLVARGLDEAARSGGADSYAEAARTMQEALVEAFAAGELHGGAWEQLNVKRAFAVVMRGALAAFYSHPWAWNEIGFGGPAYPRGYARLGVGLSESWEGEEAGSADPAAELAEPGPR